MNKITRRNFLKTWQSVLGAFAAMATIPSLYYWWWDQPHKPKNTENWIDLGKAKKVKENEWLKRPISFDVQDRWKTRTIKEMLYIFREGRNVTILSSICPHAGCLIKTENGGFVCPCHKSFFDEKGSVVEGPSPRPLDSMEWTVKKGRLFVKYEQFKTGIKIKEAMNS